MIYLLIKSLHFRAIVVWISGMVLQGLSLQLWSSGTSLQTFAAVPSFVMTAGIVLLVIVKPF